MMPSSKTVVMIAPASTTNGGTASGTVDCAGFGYITIDVAASSCAASCAGTTYKPTVLSITECDTDTASSYAAIAALTGDGASGFSIYAAKSTDSTIAKLCVDLRKRKRFLKLQVSPATTVTIRALAHLERAEVVPMDATGQNVDVLAQA